MDESLTPNAAHLLADLLESLAVPGGTHPQTVHGFQNELDLSAWRIHVERLNLVRAVDDHLRVLALSQNTSIFDQSVPHWYAGIGFAVTPWNSAANSGRIRAACPESHLNLLRALGMLIDAHPHLMITEQDRRSLLDVIEEARSLLTADSTMAPDMRGYLELLLQRAAMLLDNLEKYGAEAVRSVALELGGAMYTQAQREPEPDRRGRWASLGWGFLGGFMSKGSSNTADQVSELIEKGVKAIGGG